MFIRAPGRLEKNAGVFTTRKLTRVEMSMHDIYLLPHCIAYKTRI
jgi:hypothetical protein